MNINKNILNYLESKGVSKTDLAKKTGISKQNLNRILDSEDIKVSQLLEISNALGLPETYFFGVKTDSVIQELRFSVENLNNKLSLEKKEFDLINTRMRHTSTYINESFNYIIKNADLLSNIKSNVDQISLALSENIHCRFEYGYSKKHFEDNILYILKNHKRLPLDPKSKEYTALFKAKN